MRDHPVLRGRWILDGNRVVGDEICQEIKRLIAESYHEVAQREEGWTRLFQDPKNGSFWELSYPESERHGGGPPMLTNLGPETVRALYPDFDGGSK